MSDAATFTVTVTVPDLEKWAAEYGITDGNVVSDIASYLTTALAASAAGDVNLLNVKGVQSRFETPAAPIRTVEVRCDNCHGKVSQKNIEKYDAAGVDWAICKRCEDSGTCE